MNIIHNRPTIIGIDHGYGSYSKAVIAAVNDYFEHRGRLDADPYLETREKEDAFLLRVLETIRAGLNQLVSINTAGAMFLPPQSTSPPVTPTQ